MKPLSIAISESGQKETRLLFFSVMIKKNTISLGSIITLSFHNSLQIRLVGWKTPCRGVQSSIGSHLNNQHWYTVLSESLAIAFDKIPPTYQENKDLLNTKRFRSNTILPI